MWNASSPIFSMNFFLCGIHLLSFFPWTFVMWNASSPTFSMDFCYVECIFSHFPHGLLQCGMHLLPFSPWTLRYVECIFSHFLHGLLLCGMHLLPFSPWTFVMWNAYLYAARLRPRGPWAARCAFACCPPQDRPNSKSFRV